MTEQELRHLVSTDIVRIVTVDKQFHLLTTHPLLCTYDSERAVMLGHVRCWCLESARWISIDPTRVYAHQALNHTIPAVALD